MQLDVSGEQIEIATMSKAHELKIPCLYCRHRFAEMTYLRAAAPLLDRAEHLEKTVIFLVEAEALAVPDAAAADLLHRASLASEEEAQAEAALSAATQATEAARKVVSNPQTLEFE